MKKRFITFLLLILFFLSCVDIAFSAGKNTGKLVEWELAPGGYKDYDFNDDIYFGTFKDWNITIQDEEGKDKGCASSASPSTNTCQDSVIKSITVSDRTIRITGNNPGETIVRLRLHSTEYNPVYLNQEESITNIVTFKIIVKESQTTKITLKYNGKDVSDSSIEMNLNNSNSLQINAVTVPSGNTVTWSSNATGYLSVSNGKVTGKKASPNKVVRITAAAQNNQTVKAYVDVKIVNPNASSVSILDTSGNTINGKTFSLDLNNNKTLQLKAKVNPDGAWQSVAWKVDPADSSALTVDSSGLVTAKQAGTFTIMAVTKDDAAKSASIKVEVPKTTKIYIKNLISPYTVNLNQSEKLQLSAAAEPANALQQFTWESNNTNIAVVDSSTGLVTFTGKAGEAVIAASAKDGSITNNGAPVSGSITIKVPGTGSISIMNDTDDNVTGETITLNPSINKTSVSFSASIEPANALQRVTWSLEPKGTSLAAIDQDGKLTWSGTKAGTVTVKATSMDGVSALAYVGIPPADDVFVRKTGTEKNIKEAVIDYNNDPSLSLFAYSNPAQAFQNFTWESSDPGVASVSQKEGRYQRVEGKKAGYATITAKAADGSGKSASVDIYVDIPLKSFIIQDENDADVTGKTITVFKEQTSKINLEVKTDPVFAYDQFSWRSDNTSVADVADDGTVSIKGPGTARINVSAKDNTYLSNWVQIDVVAQSSGKGYKFTNYYTRQLMPGKLIIQPGEVYSRSSGDGLPWETTYYYKVGYAKDFIWEIEVEEGVTVIGDYYFIDIFYYKNKSSYQNEYKNGNIPIITLPDSLQIIGISAFPGKQAIKSGVMPSNLKHVGEKAFENYALSQSVTELVFSDGLQTIGAEAFKENYFTSVTLPASVYYIGPNAFDKKVTIKAPRNSYAAKWAQDNGYSLEYIDDLIPLTVSLSIHDSTGADVTGKTLPVDLEAGREIQFSAVIEPAKASQLIQWSSSDPDYAAVYSSSGLVEGLKGGKTVTITAAGSDGSGKSAAVYLKIIAPPVKSVVLSNAGGTDIAGQTIRINGDTYSLKASAEPSASSQMINWTSDNPAIATVDDNGNVSFHKKGRVRITAASAENTNISAWVELKNYQPYDQLGTLKVSKIVANPGGEVYVGITLEDNPGIECLWLELSYNDYRLTFEGFEDSGLNGWQMKEEDLFWMSSDYQDSFYNGEIIRLKFRVADNAPEGTAASVTVFCLEMFNSENDTFVPTIEAGTVTVYEKIPGDINGDGEVNIFDLIRLRRYIVDSVNVEVFANPDTNGDGDVNVFDLIRLRRYIVDNSIEIY